MHVLMALPVLFAQITSQQCLEHPAMIGILQMEQFMDYYLFKELLRFTHDVLVKSKPSPG
ncbi:hypothetical protein MBAV_002896 [Candidatus Magnetobacterium bavaricum]|uniref:Uncharacterized protein n=1 Tax=Candidatus Magnetobacterium bavaricum TaxID=29290 RepID=A0A0F3GSK8_9BACT|nr:hypothetical protein MBAV_002896 [Candidatus Magnetobacterium bavaricum]